MLENNDASSRNINENHSFKEELFKYLSLWKWFVLSILIFLGVALLHLRYSHNIYRTTAKIQVLDKKENALKMPTASELFSKSKINLSNDIELLSSYPIIKKVVEKLKLNTSFYSVGDIMTSQLIEFPFSFEQLISSDSIIKPLKFQIFFLPDGIEITDMGKDTNYLFTTYNTYSTSHDLPFNISWDKSRVLTDNKKGYQVVLSPIKSTVNKLKESLRIRMASENSDILVLEIENSNTEYYERILNTIINVFNQDGIEDKQMVHKRTIEFVNERYILLSNELDSIEIEKQLYKLKNDLIDITANSSLSLELSSKSNQELLELDNQISIAKLLSETFQDNNYNLLPANIGINNSEINFLIKDFNNGILERKNLIVSAGVNNPSVKQLDQLIVDSRKNIIQSVNNYLQQLKGTKRKLAFQSRKLSKDVATLPEKEKILRAIERSQVIKESLYLFLLQKREEAEVSYAITEPIIKVVEYAMSSEQPIFPQKKIIILLALLLGILIPFGSIYLIFLFDTKVHIRKDIEEINIGSTIMGELPLINEGQSNIFKNPEDRNILAESFRILCSNIHYLLPANSRGIKGKTIYSTSTIKGEGKTFVAINTSLALASLGNKVLLIGADLRNPQLHKYLSINKQTDGLTNYLIDDTFKWDESTLKAFEYIPSHFTLLAGSIPPNPSQLLSNGNFNKLIKEAKEKYDYIIVDTAPTLLVSDTLIISEEADATLYVCRSNYTDKEILEYPKNLINEKKIKNLGIILNGIKSDSKYRYGYRYNYGYNYGYNSSEES